MKRCLFLIVATLFTAATTKADSRTLAQAQHALTNLQMAAAELAKEAHRDAEVLRLLTQASRELDNWQKNNAVAVALEKTSKAEQLVARPPFADPKVRQAVRVAREILDPARESPMSADLPRLREQFTLRPVAWMREVVAEEMHGLAQLTTKLNDASGILAKALAEASAAALGRGE